MIITESVVRYAVVDHGMFYPVPILIITNGGQAQMWTLDHWLEDNFENGYHPINGEIAPGASFWLKEEGSGHLTRVMFSVTDPTVEQPRITMRDADGKELAVYTAEGGMCIARESLEP